MELGNHKDDQNSYESSTIGRAGHQRRLNSKDEAPNISINLYGEIRPQELALSAVIGTILQAAVLVFSGFIVYSSWGKKKLGDSDSKAGFPLLAIGTILITISMTLCAQVIDYSTKEERWIRKVRHLSLPLTYQHLEVP
jgi:hypothetical protein